MATRRRAGYNFHELLPHGAHNCVQSFSFADFIQHTGLDTIDLLKIDIEGAEKYLLTAKNAPPFRERVKYILLETHSLNGFDASHCVTWASNWP